jgi:hypothetical protein
MMTAWDADSQSRSLCGFLETGPGRGGATGPVSDKAFHGLNPFADQRPVSVNAGRQGRETITGKPSLDAERRQCRTRTKWISSPENC